VPSEDAVYEAAIARLERALTFGINPSLDGITALMQALGMDRTECPCVQVTGTNGKTSVTRMTGALLTAHGYRTGVYTSPHLVSYTERIVLEGRQIGKRKFAQYLTDVFDVADTMDREFTEFELLTATALHAFRAKKVEFACLEVGMGGRWDATSVVDPAVSVITGVSLDHTERLGATREEIAADKAHIIKRRSFPVLGPGCQGVDHIFHERALSLGIPKVMTVGLGEDPDVTWRVVRRPRTPRGTLTVDVHGLRDYRLALHAPAYQAPNVAVAMAAAGAAIFNVLDPDRANAAMRSVTFPGRFEVLRARPPLVIDGAHNPEAAAVLAGAIHDSFPDAKPVIVLGILADKDAEGIVSALAGSAAFFVTTENGSPRCLPARELAALVERVTGCETVAEPSLGSALAVAEARAGAAGVVVTGSLYTAGATKVLMG
jgi:dihydrofolate synthase/folylpolyglutamate synthase